MANKTTKHAKKIPTPPKLPHTFERLKENLQKLPKDLKL